jgi:hypothetical protein
MTDKICLCSHDEVCALCDEWNNPDVTAAADDVLARLLGGN